MSWFLYIVADDFIDDNGKTVYSGEAGVGMCSMLPGIMEAPYGIMYVVPESYIRQYLREKNLQLNLELESILYAADENKKLRQLLDFKRETQLNIIPARIVNKGIQTNLHSLTIDVGSSNGLLPNQAVLTPEGIIGKTIQTGETSSLVQSISDNNFRLSVRIMPSGAVGILRWHNNNMCKIYEVQKNVEINIGDRVITSGFSKIYPPKLPVGTVSGVYDERGSYQKVVNVEIQSDFESIQNVFVVIAHNYDIN